MSVFLSLSPLGFVLTGKGRRDLGYRHWEAGDRAVGALERIPPQDLLNVPSRCCHLGEPGEQSPRSRECRGKGQPARRCPLSPWLLVFEGRVELRIGKAKNKGRVGNPKCPDNTVSSVPSGSTPVERVAPRTRPNCLGPLHPRGHTYSLEHL